MLYFKACPRCKGDVHRDRDVFGEYLKCLQCGHMVDLVKVHGRLTTHVSTEHEAGEKVKVA